MKYAEETWDWLVNIGYIADNWDIYDGAHIESNCTDINKAQFSYNAAVLLQGMAYLYDFVSPRIGPIRLMLSGFLVSLPVCVCGA